MPLYLLKRILTFIPTFFGITLITFFMMKLAPGDIVSRRAQEGLKPEQISESVQDELRKLYGLKVDLPPGYEHFIHQATLWIHGEDPQAQPKVTRRILDWSGQNTIQYGIWLKSLMHLDFGYSQKDGRPVLDKIAETLPITLTLNVVSLFIVYFISIPLGVYSATHRESLLDKSLMLLLFVLYSLPTFWVATLLLMYFASGDPFGWFPLGGIGSYGAENLPWTEHVLDLAWHLSLPLIAMCYGSFAFLTRFSRANLLEVIQQDYIRTAKAKGLSSRQVVWKHGFRNSLIALVSLLGTLLPALLGGSVIIEEIFSIPGMGRLAFESVLAKDEYTIMAITTISAFLTLMSILLSDLAYAWVDPRISYTNPRERN